MTIEAIKNRIKMRLYGEDFSRGVMEFSWGTDDPNLFNDRLKAAKEECLKIGVKWVDADPMTARIVVLVPKELSKSVSDIMTKYGFTLVNQIFDPKPSNMLRGKDTH